MKESKKKKYMITVHDNEMKDEQDKTERIKIQSQAMEIKHNAMTEKIDSDRIEILNLKTENSITSEKLDKIQKQAEKDKKKMKDVKENLKEVEKN